MKCYGVVSILSLRPSEMRYWSVITSSRSGCLWFLVSASCPSRGARMLFIGSKALLFERCRGCDRCFYILWRHQNLNTWRFCFYFGNETQSTGCVFLLQVCSPDKLFLTSCYRRLFKGIMLPHFPCILVILFPIAFIFFLLFIHVVVFVSGTSAWLRWSNNVSWLFCLLQTLDLVSLLFLNSDVSKILSVIKN